MRWSMPTSRRTRCGTTIPMKPIGPASETAALVASDPLMKASRWALVTSTPRAAAASRPRLSRFSDDGRNANIPKAIATSGSADMTGPNPPTSRSPMSHRAARYTCAKSAMYWTNMISAEKNELSVTPASSSTDVDIARRYGVASQYTMADARAAPARLASGTGENGPTAAAAPKMIASMAPSDAPAETPSVNGVASG